ncbi:MAG: triose-phosphate isomerase [Thaumarchaeota archaeon]|nr:triose-phosphate isomerase [Nitrososphaerota archaeon]
MKIPFLLINFKNYAEVAGAASLSLAKTAEHVSQEIGVSIGVAPPTPLLSQVAKAVEIPVFAQHVDKEGMGSTTGATVVEHVKAAGCVGSIVNHSEKRIPLESIRIVVENLNGLGMVSMVCAKTPAEVASIAAFGPSFAAIEPPELIGSGRAVSKVRPDVVVDSVKAAEGVNPSVKVVCGAGVVSGEDVAAAIRLGSKGVLVASGVVKAKDWKKAIFDLALPLVKR